MKFLSETTIKIFEAAAKRSAFGSAAMVSTPKILIAFNVYIKSAGAKGVVSSHVYIVLNGTLFSTPTLRKIILVGIKYATLSRYTVAGTR